MTLGSVPKRSMTCVGDRLGQARDLAESRKPRGCSDESRSSSVGRCSTDATDAQVEQLVVGDVARAGR